MSKGPDMLALPDDAGLAALRALGRRHARILVLVPVILAMLTLGWALLRPRSYTARASFLPQRSDANRSGLGALATQLGLDLSLDRTGQSPAFYAELMRTPQLLADVASARYSMGERPDSGTLAELLRIRGRTPALQRDAVARRLGQMVDIRVDPTTDVVRIFVTSPAPELSRQLAAGLLAEVNRFNVDRRRSRAAAERQFTEERRAQAREELSEAEDRMRRFLETNRNFANSPALIATRDRLQRDVTLHQQVYSTLTQAYEQARIDEVRNTPVITVIEQPVAPARPDSRRLVMWLATSLLVGLVVALAVAVVRDHDIQRLVHWGRRPAADAGRESAGGG